MSTSIILSQPPTAGSISSPPKRTPPPKPSAHCLLIHEKDFPNETVGNPPPVPIKRSRTFRQSSSSEPSNTPIRTTPRGESYPTEASTGEKPRLTPHPRSNTLDKRRSKLFRSQFHCLTVKMTKKGLHYGTDRHSCNCPRCALLLVNSEYPLAGTKAPPLPSSWCSLTSQEMSLQNC